MSDSSVAAEEKDSAEPERESRKRIPTEKGYSYILDLKIKNFKAKRAALIKRIRATLQQRGQSSNLVEFKKELSEAQVIYSEFKDVVNDIKELVYPEENLENINRVIQETGREWLNFETEIRNEIKHLEQIQLQKTETISQISRKSSHHLSRSQSRSSNRSKRYCVSSLKEEKFRLKKEDAALKIRLAFAEEERKLKLEQKKAELIVL